MQNNNLTRNFFRQGTAKGNTPTLEDIICAVEACPEISEPVKAGIKAMILACQDHA